MKNILFVITAAALMIFSSCYVGVRGGNPHPHRAKGVIIIADKGTATDSTKTSAQADVTPNDSLKTVVNPAAVK